MKRKITEKLVAWKNKSKSRMPLLVYGARQVGKTYIIRQFGAQQYKNIAEINMETNKTVREYFENNIEPERIIRFLETEVRERIVPGETLIFFDEVQSCPRALTAMKYFNENTPEYHIVCAGSLLGVAINREEFSFPVGNVDSLTMFPFDFEEFLWSQNEEMLCEEIKKSFGLYCQGRFFDRENLKQKKHPRRWLNPRGCVVFSYCFILPAPPIA